MLKGRGPFSWIPQKAFACNLTSAFSQRGRQECDTACKKYTASSASCPSARWLDCISEGGLRHRLLDWSGNGPLVLFFHANSLCAGVWGPVVQRLKGIRAIAVDLRGHGDTCSPEHPDEYHWSLFGKDFLNVVRKVAEDFGKPPDVCVTHSFAGDTALIGLAEQKLHVRGVGKLSVDRIIMLDPVLADAEGASVGAKRLAKGTLRLGEKESGGFDSPRNVGNSLENALTRQLVRVELDADAKTAFTTHCSFGPDHIGRWRLKAKRSTEAAVYANRIALGDYLSDQVVSSNVHLIFAARRRGRLADQDALFKRDWKEAENVVAKCGHHSSLEVLHGVGHFLVLEAPELVAEVLQPLLVHNG